MFLGTLFEERDALVFSDLQFLSDAIQQIEDGLIVDLDVAAFDIKSNLGHPFVTENFLVVEAVAFTHLGILHR